MHSAVINIVSIALLALLNSNSCASGNSSQALTVHKQKKPETEQGLIKIHAVHKENFSCSEHWDGQFDYPGDALGTDCTIAGWYEDETRLFQRSYRADGFNNDDWFGYRKNVLAPCDCVVDSIHINKVSNQPGIMTPGRASSVTFKTTDGDFILYAHVREVSVSLGEQVKKGQVFAKVGNNGYSRNPHIHIGAWSKAGKALQIRFDQKTIGLGFRERKLKQ